MAGKFTVSLGKIIDEFHLETIYMPKDPTEILIDENDVTRPGLQLMGFYEYFNPERMQIIGKMEFAYLSTIDEETRTQRLDALMSRHIPALIIARELPYFSEMLDLAKKYEVPLLRSKESTSNFISGLIAFLNLNLAPRITRHGVLIEIYGEGVFITGESGVGKSETAIELVKRGHRLVADDGRDPQGFQHQSGGQFSGQYPPLPGTAWYRYHQRPPAVRYRCGKEHGKN